MSPMNRVSRAAATDLLHVCHEAGCERDTYRGGYCSDHWKDVPEATCGHRSDLLIRCGCCNRRVCHVCYGPWNALACVSCCDKARQPI